MPKSAYTPPRSSLNTFIPDAPSEPEPVSVVEPIVELPPELPPPPPPDDRRVHSYKIRPSIGRRLRKYAHNQDRPIALVAEEAFLEYLDRKEAQS